MSALAQRPARDVVTSLPAFRRLAGKTQVLVAPADASLRTRLTHTLEVVANARRIARGLGLDEDLTEAIALAHDVGHPAFGHAGERALARLAPGGFHHAAHGARVLTALLPRGVAIHEAVVDGVLKHSKGRSGPPFARGASLRATRPEALVVRAADLYAYASHDLEDATSLGLVHADDLPAESRAVLGASPESVREALVASTLAASDATTVALEPEVERALEALRAHLYEHLYESSLLAAQTARAASCVERLFAFYVAAEDEFLLAARRLRSPASSVELRAVDAIASLCDREALDLVDAKVLSPAA